MVLGVLPDLSSVPSETEEGVLRRGDALLLYTDGMVEAPGEDIDEGIDRLLGEAERMVAGGGFSESGASNLVTEMQKAIDAADDRALVLIWRT